MNELQKKMIRISAESERFLRFTDEMVDLTLPNGKVFYKQRIKKSLNFLVEELEKITNYVLRPDKSDNDAAQLQMLNLVSHLDEEYNKIWNDVEIQIQKEKDKKEEIKNIEDSMSW